MEALLIGLFCLVVLTLGVGFYLYRKLSRRIDDLEFKVFDNTHELREYVNDIWYRHDVEMHRIVSELKEINYEIKRVSQNV